MSPRFADWLVALEERHLADLRVPEVTRALRALSSAYVERRHKVAAGATLDSAGKRAAFALFYAPLHYLAVAYIVSAAAARVPRTIIDVGCGSGAAGAPPTPEYLSLTPIPSRTFLINRIHAI